MEQQKLQEYDGKDGKPAYVAYDGKIYDVSTSRMWKNGVHARVHKAGEDLTEAMKNAPHGAEVLKRFTEVDSPEGAPPASTVSGSADPLAQWQQWYRKYHPHPMLIHFPIGLLNFAILMQLLFLVTGQPTFETTAFHAMAVMVLSIIPTSAAGWFSWKINYNSAWNSIFAVKIICTAILFILATLVVFLRLSVPDIALNRDGLFWIYMLLFFGQIPFSAAIGYKGGKLTWT
ncbi:hypothetical protein LGV61_03960 [Desulfurispirillum indicum]|uniref:DUF2231 domain-containing protein n=1 Tax=Desulfurispirillum indicum TaxID=936456 RepID=UPI001CFB7951|nr:DUF2231 domain-containing protein [Desulfurispirillum indicum]UCZ57441.1 hypothetical protein LGV61_03960 [Desulfurispirillum indicum]